MLLSYPGSSLSFGFHPIVPLPSHGSYLLVSIPPFLSPHMVHISWFPSHRSSPLTWFISSGSHPIVPLPSHGSNLLAPIPSFLSPHMVHIFWLPSLGFFPCPGSYLLVPISWFLSHTIPLSYQLLVPLPYPGSYLLELQGYKVVPVIPYFRFLIKVPLMFSFIGSIPNYSLISSSYFRILVIHVTTILISSSCHLVSIFRVL